MVYRTNEVNVSQNYDGTYRVTIEKSQFSVDVFSDASFEKRYVSITHFHQVDIELITCPDENKKILILKNIKEWFHICFFNSKHNRKD